MHLSFLRQQKFPLVPAAQGHLDVLFHVLSVVRAADGDGHFGSGCVVL